MIVLDTDMLTFVQRGSGSEYDNLAARLTAASDDQVCATIISLEEQMRGWLGWIANARTLERQALAYGRLRALFEDFQTSPVLDFDEAPIDQFRRLTRLRIRIGTMDLKIAATVLAHDALLLSGNLSDFRVVSP